MSSENRIEIIDREGWRKEFPIEKRISYIGSDPRNDIALNPLRGSGVTPRHLQLIIPQPGSEQISIVNLSEHEVLFDGQEGKSLPPFSAQELSDGERIQLGEYLLIFHLQETVQHAGYGPTPYQPANQPVETNMASASVGLRAAFPKAVLSPEGPLQGVLYVRNQGTAPGVQFAITLEGLPADCFEIGAAPILFPGAEKGIGVRIFHPRRPEIPAGVHKITFTAYALDAYPGESAVVSLDIQILPFYHHALELVEAG